MSRDELTELAMDLMRYGKITLTEHFQGDSGLSTVRIIKYGGIVWYVRMTNGNVRTVKRIGKS